MFATMFRFGAGLVTVLSLSLVAVGQPGGHRFVGTSQHTVGGQRVVLHHHAAQGNHKSAQHLQGVHRIGAAQGKKQANFDLHANKGRFAVTANGKSNGIRNTRVTTVKGNKNHNGRPHPGAGIGKANVSLDDGENLSLDGMQWVSLENSEGEYSLTQIGGGFVTINIMFQIGTDGFGNPLFANVSFQMDLGQFLLLIGMQQPFPQPDPQQDPQLDPQI